jgi:CheY-like chemotaxis protein
MSERAPLILLVDDDRDTRDMYAMALETCGYRVAHADSAAAGITLASAERPDVVVSDFTLPGEDGFVFAAHVRETAELADTPMILLSGHVFSGADEDRAVRLFDRVLLKPVLPDNLVGEIIPLVEDRTAARLRQLDT